MRKKFNWTAGLIGFVVGVASGGASLGVVFALIAGYMLFPENE